MQHEKEKLQNTLAKVIKTLRGKKSISKISNEIGLSKSIWFEVEKGRKDVQFSTFWRIAEALNITPSELLKLIENDLNKNFTLID